ncbi:hypothetical protein NM688_g4190 [Phlebia brevispora]|uniref:Uncharacterized protein n=1 Tax=Phlebia brevispora TaxID=194682 RepID=A0ACC1T3U0_9APHY|nr:hypothetical protein NM688_g4190 [Phlebia brevispora]
MLLTRKSHERLSPISSPLSFLSPIFDNYIRNIKSSQSSPTSLHSFGPYEESNSAPHSPVLSISKFLNRSKGNLASSPRSPIIQLNTEPLPVAQPPTLPSTIFALNDDTLFHVMLLADKRTLGRCSQVCRIWYNLAMDALWGDGRHSGILAVLSYMDKFYQEPVDAIFKKRQAMLAASPSPACWKTFENQTGRRICAFTLDLKSLVVDPEFLNLLLASAPDKISLPCLQKFRVIVNQDGPELNFVKKFLTGGIIRHLELEIWDPVLDDKRALRVMQRETERGIPQFRRGSQPAPSAHPLDDLFESIATHTPDLTHLAFAMRDKGQMKKTWDAFLVLVSRLPKLQTLQLPAYTLTPEVIYGLAGHPFLEHLVVYESAAKMHRITLSELCDTPFIPRDRTLRQGLLGGSSALEHLTDLAITATPTQAVSFLNAQQSHKLHGLRVIFCEHFTDAAEASGFFVALAAACPAVRDLKLGPLLSGKTKQLHLSPNYEMLLPLMQCSDLESLEIVAAYTSQFTNEEFTHLVSGWKRLRRLVLDHCHLVPAIPFEEAGLSMGAATFALQRSCPLMVYLFLYVSLDTDCPSELTGVDSHFVGTRSSFQAVNFCIGFSPTCNPGQVARFLGSNFPQTCQINLHNTTRKIFDVMEAVEEQLGWENRRRALNTYINRIVLTQERIKKYRRHVLL